MHVHLEDKARRWKDVLDGRDVVSLDDLKGLAHDEEAWNFHSSWTKTLLSFIRIALDCSLHHVCWPLQRLRATILVSEIAGGLGAAPFDLVTLSLRRKW